MDNNGKIRISINQDVRRHVINACIQWARIRGYSDSVGLLRGLSVMAREPVSLDELVQETGYSKSTVSSNMNLLEDLGLVARIVIPGDKRHIYAPIIDPKMIMANMLDMIERELRIFCEALERTEDEIDAAGADAEWLRERTAALKQSYRHGQSIIKIVKMKTNEQTAAP
jgi:HTH-type transcriptional regulator, glycine betaine synthesis regulator